MRLGIGPQAIRTDHVIDQFVSLIAFGPALDDLDFLQVRAARISGRCKKTDANIL